MQQADRNWFITGITGGLGRHLAQELLKRGERVFGTSRRPEQLTDLQRRYPEQLHLAELDLTDVPAMRSVVARAFEMLGRIDVVVNNAGYTVIGAAEELQDDAIGHLLATNLVGSMQLVRAVVPHLRRQGGGRIVQISSGAGHMGVPGLSLYCASKWGVEGFFESVAPELASFGIETTLVEPGAMKTAFGTHGVVSPELDIYRDSPVGHLRRAASEGYEAPVDPARCARLIADSLATTPAPQRLVLGSDSYGYITMALEARLAQVQADRALAPRADFAATAH